MLTLLSKCNCGSKTGHMNGHDLVCDGCKTVLKVFNTVRQKRLNSYTRIFPQVDIVTCIRCSRVESPYFIFDDGSFYCHRCFTFMKGGDANA